MCLILIIEFFLSAFIMKLYSAVLYDFNIQDNIEKRVLYEYNKTIVVADINEFNTKYYFASNCKFHPLTLPLEKAIFEIGSITKLFTAHLAILLQKEGLLSLDLPIENYLPKLLSIPCYKDKKITIRHLLTHTSGIEDPWQKNYFNVNGNTTAAADFTLQDLYCHLSNFELTRAPGTKIHYSNLGYGLIGHILEIVTKKSYQEILNEKILNPLNLEYTFLEVPNNLKHLLIEGTSHGQAVPYWKINSLPAFGALKSTAEDLVKYLRHLFFASSYPVDCELIEILTSPYLKWDKDEIISTAGWTIDQRYGSSFFAVTGKTLGFTSFIGYSPHEHRALILLTDSDSLDFLGHHFFNSNFPLQKLYKPIVLTREELTSFSGSYKTKIDGDEMTIKVSSLNNHLALQINGDQPFYIYPFSKNQFFMKYFDETSKPLEFTEINGIMTLNIPLEKNSSLAFVREE